jgi:hypothetical protein
MRVFRIALAEYGAIARSAFSGQSGYRADGRRHSRGRYLDYATESRSLATLERLVHYTRFDSLTRVPQLAGLAKKSSEVGASRVFFALEESADAPGM